MLQRTLVAAAAAGMFLPIAAEAAMVQVLDGPVFVNRGQGFREIVGAANVAAGNLVKADSTGRAQIFYDNGCRTQVDPGRTVAIGRVPPCQLNMQVENDDRRGAFWDYVIGGAILGPIIAAIIISEDDDGGRRPASP